jgi:hypothetical protein
MIGSLNGRNNKRKMFRYGTFLGILTLLCQTLQRFFPPTLSRSGEAHLERSWLRMLNNDMASRVIKKQYEEIPLNKSIFHSKGIYNGRIPGKNLFD